MATTKKATLPVVKHKKFIIAALGSRTRRELEQEIRDLGAQGYKVYALRKLDRAKDGQTGVEIQLGKAEDWSVEDFMTEVDEMLGEAR